jgi:probable O-glycosylation ligase (exosortase A-associated)
MKQTLLLTVLSVLAAIGALSEPFWAVLLYYFLAVLRPQFLWDWALPGDVRWSLAAAGFVFFAVLINLPRVFALARPNVILGLTVAFGSLLMVSCLASANPHLAMSWGADFGKIILMAIVAGLLIHRASQVWWLAVAMFAATGYIAYEVNHQYLLRGYQLDIFHNGFGGLDNNGAGLVLAMGLPFAYALGVGWQGRHALWVRGATAAAGLLMIHAIMLTYSRGAMLAALIAAGWLVLRHRPRGQAVAAAAAMLVVVAVLAGPEVRDRFTSTAAFSEDDSAQARLTTWKIGWALAWERPLTGHGIRNSRMLMQSYDAELDGRTIHSMYLQIAADSGIPALLVFCALLGAAWWRCGRMANEDGPLGPIARACQTSLLVYAIGGVFLSVEVFEPAWLILVMAGVLPLVSVETQEQEEQPMPALAEVSPA